MSPSRTFPEALSVLRAAAPWLLAGAVVFALSPVAASDAVKTVSSRPAAAPAPAVPPAEAPQGDPLDRLRERLAERLGGVKMINTPAALKLRVATRTPQTSGAAARSGAGGGAAGQGRPAPPATSPWSYSGATGPQAWAGLRPEYSLCGSGQRQSPIDLREGIAVDLEPIRFSYQSSGFGVVDNGLTLQVNVAPGNHLELAGRRYELQHMRFQRPSEERIDGRQFDMGVQLLHKDSEGRLLVVALLLDRGSPQPVVQTLWNNLPLEKNQEVKARVSVDLGQLLPTDRRYYTYMGSLSTPPCSEGVQRVVMRHPVTLSPEQFEIFSRLYPVNARPLQAAQGRRILQSN